MFLTNISCTNEQNLCFLPISRVQMSLEWSPEFMFLTNISCTNDLGMESRIYVSYQYLVYK